MVGCKCFHHIFDNRNTIVMQKQNVGLFSDKDVLSRCCVTNVVLYNELEKNAVESSLMH